MSNDDLKKNAREIRVEHVHAALTQIEALVSHVRHALSELNNSTILRPQGTVPGPEDPDLHPKRVPVEEYPGGLGKPKVYAKCGKPTSHMERAGNPNPDSAKKKGSSTSKSKTPGSK